MSNEWQWKCPSCDELLGDGVPYRTLSALSAPTSGGFDAVPINGRRFRCDCGTTVDIPHVLHETPGSKLASGWDELHGEEFDRWLAAHERGIRADQIERDAAIAERLSDYYRSAKYAAVIRAQFGASHE